MIKIEKFVVNPLGENSFVLFDETGECVFVDPGFYYQEEHNEIKDFIAQHKLSPKKIINTHCHFDHIMGVEFVRNAFNIPFWAHEKDSFWVNNATEQAGRFGLEVKHVNPIDEYLQENDTVQFGNSELKVIHVPGHAPGHVVFYCEEDKFSIAGDVLFYGSIGRTDLPGGDHATLISNIKTKLFALPEDTKVYCGHGPETSIGFEKSSNPFLT